MMRWSISNYEQFGSRAALPVFMTSGTFAPTQSAVLNWTRTFSPTIVNEARLSYSRVGIDEGEPVDWSGLLGTDGNSQFGIAGGQPFAGLSAVNIDSVLALSVPAALSAALSTIRFNSVEKLTWQRGSHLLKIGGQAVRYRQNRYYAGNNGALGFFTYDGTVTGVPYADFLLDQLTAKGRGSVTGKWGHRHWRDGLFVQDDWKAARKSDGKLGMRWEYSSRSTK